LFLTGLFIALAFIAYNVLVVLVFLAILFMFEKYIFIYVFICMFDTFIIWNIFAFVCCDFVRTIKLKQS